jgi:hypothetical protein
MTEHSFSLIPFPDACIPAIKITGRITRNNNLLSIHYSLSGDVDAVLLPGASAQPTRKNDLWRMTCFEFFLALPAQPHYWEFNMSPSGDWNIYRMDAYRRVGFREETSFQRLPFSLKKDAGRISIDVEVGLDPIIQIDMPIQAAVTSIIQTENGHETYWAFAHPNPQADFHLRESFIIHL